MLTLCNSISFDSASKMHCDHSHSCLFPLDENGAFVYRPDDDQYAAFDNAGVRERDMLKYAHSAAMACILELACAFVHQGTNGASVEREKDQRERKAALSLNEEGLTMEEFKKVLPTSSLATILVTMYRANQPKHAKMAPYGKMLEGAATWIDNYRRKNLPKFENHHDYPFQHLAANYEVDPLDEIRQRDDDTSDDDSSEEGSVADGNRSGKHADKAAEDEAESTKWNDDGDSNEQQEDSLSDLE